MPETVRQPEDAAAAAPASSGAASSNPSNPGNGGAAADFQELRRKGGWPLPVKILLAAVVLGFVWSPFLAMLVRLSNISPDLAPDAQPTGIPDLAPPLTPAGSPAARGRRSPAPSP